MRTTWLFGTALLVVAGCATSGAWNAGDAPSADGKTDGTCTRKAVLIDQDDVWRDIPDYYTGVGWTGDLITTLSAETQVYICDERTTDFGLSSKLWFQVAYRNQARWHYGWADADYIVDWE